MQKGGESEWKRSLFHIGSGLTIVILYGLTGITKNRALVILGIITLLFLLGDTSRQFVPEINRLVKKVFRNIMRQKERVRLAASSYYLIGCWVTIFTFSKVAACICILFLAIGDTLTKIIRQVSTKQKTPYRTLEAILSNFLTSFLIAWFILKTSGITNPAIPSSLGALGASVGELVPKIDNLTIPLISGILLSAGFYLIR